MTNISEKIFRRRIIPVVKIDAVDAGPPLFQAIRDGGLPVAEVTLRTDCALEVIREGSRIPGFQVGAGTVLNPDQCERALDAGACFVVSPGLDGDIVALCRHRNVPCLPGVATATEIQTALNLGVRVAKFFPAEALGGVATLQALAGPFRQMQFVPTGGINANNVRDYLALPGVRAVGGSWMVKPGLYQDGNFDPVTRLTAEVVELVKN